MQPEILLTNDDGARAPGILALAAALRQRGISALICAPARNKSACSHAFSLTAPLRLETIAPQHFALDDATPADCVHFALARLCSRPALVVAGINAGANLAEDIAYSGTAGAAMEAAFCGVPAVALSEFYRHAPGDFARSAELGARFIEGLLRGGYRFGEREFLNVNFPDAAGPWRGFASAVMGQMPYAPGVSAHRDPRGGEYFWLEAAFDIDAVAAAPGSDIALVREGFASVMSCRVDFCDHSRMPALSEFLKNFE